MDNLPLMDEDSLIRYIRLLTEATKKRFLNSYQVERLTHRGRDAFYLLKNNENPALNVIVMGRQNSWTFTMNQGLNRLVVSFINKQFIDDQGLISFLDIIRGTINYEYNGSPSYTYDSRRCHLSLEEYIYAGAREVNLNSTLRPISEVWIEELELMKQNQNHFLVTLITAQVSVQFINSARLKE